MQVQSNDDFFGVCSKKHETSSWMNACVCLCVFARKPEKRYKIKLRLPKALFYGILKGKQRILWVDMETMFVEYFVADFSKNVFTLKCTNKHVPCKSISSISVCNLASILSEISANSYPIDFRHPIWACTIKNMNKMLFSSWTMTS